MLARAAVADLDGVVGLGGAVHKGAQAGVQRVSLAVLEQQVGDELHQQVQAVLLPLQAPDVQLHVTHQARQRRHLQRPAVSTFRMQGQRHGWDRISGVCEMEGMGRMQGQHMNVSERGEARLDWVGLESTEQGWQDLAQCQGDILARTGSRSRRLSLPRHSPAV